MTRIALVLVGCCTVVVLVVSTMSPAPATRPAEREKRSLKIFIVCDSEGGSGIVEYWSRNVPPGNPRFQEYRELMTRDINAAIEGCFQAGATEVVVSDDGFGGTCTVPELMDSRASWIRGPGFGTGTLPLLAGLDSSFDGLMLIGFHPMEGTEKGVLAHTWSSAGRRRFTIQGKPAGELAIYSIIAGHDHAVPVILVQGDEAVCQEGRDLLGVDLVTVAVKKGLSEQRALLVAPGKARTMITVGARQAVEEIQKREPYLVKMPIEVQLQLENKEKADAHGENRLRLLPDWPGRRVDEQTFEATLSSTRFLSL
ncbi:MAG: peptidase M55 [Planctomycetaceae bacterium]|jgi:D-amino peptidase|nr:peptidase M55 [Planctomycetaceae bacterium]|tara:strand:- start:1177 stop:2112 length:936 start_codon:yes stop_codon:yes gene_type:complete